MPTYIYFTHTDTQSCFSFLGNLSQLANKNFGILYRERYLVSILMYFATRLLKRNKCNCLLKKRVKYLSASLYISPKTGKQLYILQFRLLIRGCHVDSVELFWYNSYLHSSRNSTISCLITQEVSFFFKFLRKNFCFLQYTHYININ